MASIISCQTLCKRWGTLTEYRFTYDRRDGSKADISREVYDRGQAAAVLLHDPGNDLVTLVRQFRPPAMVNGNDPFLLEVCAGMLDGDDPEACVRREALEEAGVLVKDLRFVSRAYGHPAAVTERLSMYIGTYDSACRVSKGGGLAQEEEDIEVVELGFRDAYEMIAQGDIVDMKTIILLQALQLENSRSQNGPGGR